MERDFELPDVGEGLEEATIVEWSVRPGDHVSLNDTVCAIETAKAEVELPSPFTGTVVATNGRPGDTLHVGDLLIRFEVDEAEAAAKGGGGAGTGTDNAARKPTMVGYGLEENPTTKHTSRQWPRRAARTEETTPGTVRAEGQTGDQGRRDTVPAAAPPVRKLAKDLGVDIALVVPTGARGEVTRDDVRAAAGADVESVADAGRSSFEIPVRGVRARIANRMSVSRSTIPEATCGVWVDCAHLLELRNQRTAAGASDPAAGSSSVTPFTMIAWLAVRALGVAPLFNATFHRERDVIEVHRSVHLGIATTTEQGLMVVVLHDADLLALDDFGLAMSDLIRRGRAGTLTPRELTGSTFTVNNFGALGLDDADPIINYPEAALLGVGSIRPRPAVVDGAIVPRPLLKLIAAFDHRVCDGAEAGRYLSRLRELVEQPELWFPEPEVRPGASQARG